MVSTSKAFELKLGGRHELFFERIDLASEVVLHSTLPDPLKIEVPGDSCSRLWATPLFNN